MNYNQGRLKNIYQKLKKLLILKVIKKYTLKPIVIFVDKNCLIPFIIEVFLNDINPTNSYCGLKLLERLKYYIVLELY